MTESHQESRRTTDENSQAPEGEGRQGGGFFSPEQIREYERKCVRDSIANRFPAGTPDRRIAEAYRRETQSLIISESMRGDRTELDDEMIRHMQLECHAIDELLKKHGDDGIPELHDNGAWICFLTQLEQDEMTPEEWAEEENKVNRLLAELEAQQAGEATARH